MNYSSYNNLSPSQSCYPGDKDNRTDEYILTRVEDISTIDPNSLREVFYMNHINIGTVNDFGINPTYINTINGDFVSFITAVHKNFEYLYSLISNSSTPSEPDTPQTSPYYFYVGLNRPDNSTTISNVVTGGLPGWHLIGDSLEGINVNNRAHDSSNPSNMISVEPTYETDDGVDYYIVIPTELNIYDGLGNNIINSARYTNLGNVEIQGHTYKVIKDHDFDFIFNIY